MNRKKKIGIIITIAVLIILIKIFDPLANLYTDWLWFKSLHYEKVFTTMLFSKICLGIISGIVFFIVTYTNLWLARKLCPSDYSPIADIFERFASVFKQFFGLIVFLLMVVISVFVGIGAAEHWENFQLFTHPASFSTKDPIFGLDLSFYMFSYPFLKYIYNWFFGVVATSFILTGLMYFTQSAMGYREETISMSSPVPTRIDGGFFIKQRAKTHLLILVALMFFIKCFGHIFHTFELLFKKNPLFTGISYTDHKVVIPCLCIMIIVGIICGIMVLLNIKSKSYKPLVSTVVTVILANVLFLGLVPGLFEKFIVTPNQLEKEKPYIEHAIEFTNKAYGLDGIKIKDFAAESTLTPQDIAENRTTVDNIRLWDARQLMHSYSQVQTIQQYYSFKDIDVDRYWIRENNGEKKYRQVWLSARELDFDASKTWVNTRLQYTHGYGYVMSPVNEISTEGMPKFFVYDIPPKTHTDVPIDTMGIYVGESKSHEIFVDTKTKEFDYPKGSQTVTNSYDGNDGIPISNFFRRLLFAWKFRDINIIFNTDITNRSQILFNRNISERISTLLPFMKFDPDPYLVTSGGKLYWMIDGFTESGLYPYSEKEGNFNYIRNSFKIVIDAYSGEVDVYYTDAPKEDPVMHAYNKIYKGVFKDIKTMPQDLRNHIRYSMILFKKQTQVYETYHQTDPLVFYNKSDMWSVPNSGSLGENREPNIREAYITDEYGETRYVSPKSSEEQDPYYTIMKLPENTGEEFILMNTFTRKGKKNMCSWICVGCDNDQYGKIMLYNFPKDKNVYGPEQIIAKAKQDDIISPQISLWNQEGSGVSTGNLLTIPIENSLLYVLPLYLESTNTKIPELKRVIVALGDRIVMENDLNSAISKLIGSEIPKTVSYKTAAKETPLPKDNSSLKAKIAECYKKAKEAAQQGNWAEYGKEIDNLGTLINQL